MRPPSLKDRSTEASATPGFERSRGSRENPRGPRPVFFVRLILAAGRAREPAAAPAGDISHPAHILYLQNISSLTYSEKKPILTASSVWLTLFSDSSEFPGSPEIHSFDRRSADERTPRRKTAHDRSRDLRRPLNSVRLPARPTAPAEVFRAGSTASSEDRASAHRKGKPR